MSSFDRHELTIPCAHCGHETKKTLGWLKSHPEFLCRCGVVTFKAHELVKGLRETERTIDRLTRL